MVCADSTGFARRSIGLFPSPGLALRSAVEDLLAGQLPFLHHGPGSTGIATSHHSFVLQADLWEGISSPHLQVRQLQTLRTRGRGSSHPCSAQSQHPCMIRLCHVTTCQLYKMAALECRPHLTLRIPACTGDACAHAAVGRVAPVGAEGAAPGGHPQVPQGGAHAA